ncbi:MAG: cytochrome c [Flavobacterium sp.]|nr:cytochrome c [Flavobacterium sp.]
MKSLQKILMVLIVAISIISCRDKSKPNIQYMPNMYEAVSYETYQEDKVFKGGVEAQLPAKGSVKRGFDIYDYPNSNEGYDAAKLNSKSPLDSIAINKEAEHTKEMFEIYCGICHGNKGDGKGWLVNQGKILGVPHYKDRDITVGSVNHVLKYGINTMGNYANQLNQHERWLVADYVMKLRAEALK